MNTTLLLLFTAALLEAGGDALVRSGLRAAAIPTKLFFFLAGAVVLFSYGYVVNTPSWDFGKLIGVYIVFFFIIAQLISWLVFQQPPGRTLLVGGAFIVAGGAIISLG